MATTKTHYEELRVSRNARLIEIEHAYQSLGRTYRQDNEGRMSEDTRERVGRIALAYEVLSSPTLRNEYDRALAEGRAETARARAVPKLEQHQLYRWSFERPPLEIGTYAGTSFADAVRRAADLRAGDLVRLSIPRHASMDGAEVGGVNFHALQATGVSFKGAQLAACVLKVAHLSEADLSHSNLSWADLKGAFLKEADLSHSRLFEANLTGATLRQANLTRADLRGAKMAADMLGAEMFAADLRGADFTDARGLNAYQVLDAARLVPGGPPENMMVFDGARFPPEIEAAIQAQRVARGHESSVATPVPATPVPQREVKEPVLVVVQKLAFAMSKVAETRIVGADPLETRAGEVARAATLRGLAAYGVARIAAGPDAERVKAGADIASAALLVAGRESARFWIEAETRGPGALIGMADEIKLELGKSRDARSLPQNAEEVKRNDGNGRQQASGISL